LVGFGFFPILKDEDKAGNEDIDTHPEPALFILISYLKFLLGTVIRVGLNVKRALHTSNF
jgi:hypothetical protein